jgi:predicted AAA+ superfamily ATPase
LRKEPKIYLRDWSLLEPSGARLETFVACHLLKAVQWWEDLGLGTYGLFYLRDKQKREVDFLVARNNQPWFLVEVKSSQERPLSDALRHFQSQTGALHAFQAALDMPFVDRDCFAIHEPMIVSAKTLLSQLV